MRRAAELSCDDRLIPRPYDLRLRLAGHRETTAATGAVVLVVDVLVEEVVVLDEVVASVVVEVAELLVKGSRLSGTDPPAPEDPNTEVLAATPVIAMVKAASTSTTTATRRDRRSLEPGGRRSLESRGRFLCLSERRSPGESSSKDHNGSSGARGAPRPVSSSVMCPGP
jgi:hypothetical protein